MRNALAAAESAIAMLLLAGAGLLIASFVNVRAAVSGSSRAGVLTARIRHTPPGYDSAAAVSDFERRVLDHVRAIPGVVSAGGASTLPLERGWNLPMTLVARPDVGEGAVEWRAVSPLHFRTFGIPSCAVAT